MIWGKPTIFGNTHLTIGCFTFFHHFFHFPTPFQTHLFRFGILFLAAFLQKLRVFWWGIFVGLESNKRTYLVVSSHLKNMSQPEKLQKFWG